MLRFLPYILKSLWRHRLRTGLTVSGAAVALFVYCFVGAVQEGLARLAHDRQAERTLVVAPATLTVQWLGELWRKYHQVFVLLDDARLADVEKDFGPGFNPFDAHRRAVVSLETLVARPKLTEQEVEAFARMANVSEDVLRTIGHTRAWVKNYGILLGLTKNPKTPLALSLTFLHRLNDRDLRGLSIDRNVPEPLRIAARKKIVLAEK